MARREIGEVIAGRYRVEGLLGAGGVAGVYRVLDTSTGHELALKQLTSANNARVAALFEREYHTLAGLEHARIVRVHEYGSDLGGPYYTMELLQGRDLNGLAPLPWRDVCAALRDVATALSFIHARRVIYRDINPRNLWQLPDGRIKLIDFGALTPFGTASEVVGTVPFVSHESLFGGSLDQRTDLYALGALAYFLLSGKHVYPARQLAELPQLWEYPVVPVSEVVAKLGRDDLPAVPAELDSLILALLKSDIAERPFSAAELIDRFSAIGGLDRDPEQAAVTASLNSPAFIGRGRERRRVRRRLRLARSGRGSCLVIGSNAGEGRSRLLGELLLDARIARMTALRIEGTAREDQDAVTSAVVLKLLDALPFEAQALAEPYASILGHLSSGVRQRLGAVPLARLPHTPGEARPRIHAALRDWVRAVSRAHPLLLLVDDLELIDESSAAWLAGMAHDVKTENVMLVMTLDLEEARNLCPPARALYQTAKRMTMKPLSAAEILELLRSMFGEAAHLRGVAECLHRGSNGNVGHCLDLVEHLVDGQAISYAGGSWVLPADVPQELIAQSRDQALARRLERLPPHARSLGQALSIRAGLLPLEVCLMLSEGSPWDAHDALDTLVREGVLTGDEEGYRFKHEASRGILCVEITPERARSLHRRLGHFLLAKPDLGLGERLRAGLHLLKGGERERAVPILAAAARTVAIEDFEGLAGSVPALVEAVTLLDAERAPAVDVVCILGALTTASYYTDHRLSRYGVRAIAIFEDLVGLTLAKKLRPWLGRTLSLLMAFACASLAISFRGKDPRLPSFKDALQLLFNAVGSLGGVYATTLDHVGASRCARALEPFSVLGRNHSAALTYELTLAMVSACEDRPARTVALSERVAERLDDPTPIRDLPDLPRRRLLGGALSILGVQLAYRDDPSALGVADRLDALDTKLYAMAAEQVRAVWYGHHGNPRLAAEHRERGEMHAIELGTSWQTETFGPAIATGIALRTRDALACKEAAEHLRWLSRTIPSLERLARGSQGLYSLLRKKPLEALPALEEWAKDEPLSAAGWASVQGALACAYNELDDPKRAHEICERALSYVKEEDLRYPATTSALRVEFALAQAGLGRLELAATELDAQLASHREGKGPLTLGLLHEARALVAYQAKDMENYDAHVAQMEAWLRPTGIPSLLERCERMLKDVTASVNVDRLLGSLVSAENESRVLEAIMGESAAFGPARFDRALHYLATAAGAAEAKLFEKQPRGIKLVGAVGKHEPSSELIEWVEARIAFAEELHSETVVVASTVGSEELDASPNVRTVDERTERVVVLYGSEHRRDEVVGAIVFASDGPIETPPPRLLQVIAEPLGGAMTATV
jgi:tetratricopeptide (TPR) repeat protein